MLHPSDSHVSTFNKSRIRVCDTFKCLDLNQNLEWNPDSGVKVLEKSSTFYSIEWLNYKGIILYEDCRNEKNLNFTAKNTVMYQDINAIS